ncbi:MAG: nicotinate-nucleotide adenylyltransferase [Pseudomonadota bacterium]
MARLKAPIGIFGGTFDPVHFGHLRSAFELKQALSLAQIRFIPCGNPPHRAAPIAEAALRVEMLRCATRQRPGFVVDDREVQRPGLSYTVDTLDSLREEFPATPLCLIVGMDSFLSLPKWYHWQRILDLAHVVVAHRPGWQVPGDGALGQLLTDRGTELVADLHAALAGLIFVHEVTQLEIASTGIRALIAEGHDPQFLMPDCVATLIREAGCYGSTPGKDNET